ncbi:hypothetical protein ABK040_006652 [Willaertia magna]
MSSVSFGKFNPDVDCQLDDGDTAWVSVSTILVLCMAGALAFFEAGLSRKKETLTIFSQIWVGLSLLAVCWILFGYTLVFGPSQGGFIGGLDYLAFVNVDFDKCSQHALTIPHASFACFQMMFACITPLLMTGAFAERLKWKSYIIMVVLWEILVYYPCAHIIWGGGFLSHQPLDTLDFAGGIVIHVSSGIAALVCALVFGKRKDFDVHHGEPHPSNIPLAAIGAALLWMGWFGFNAGSALSSSGVAVVAIVNTHAAACVSTIVWMFMYWIQNKKPSMVSILNGSIAGMAGVTPASGYISVHSALVLGFVLGAFSYLSIYLLKHKLKIDDALDVSSVHGVTGLIGSIAIGFCASLKINPNGADGVFYGNGWQLVAQIVGVAFVLFWSGTVTFILALTIRFLNNKWPIFLVSTKDEEEDGLDGLEFAEISAYEETVSPEALKLLLEELEKKRIRHMKSLIETQQEQILIQQKHRRTLLRERTNIHSNDNISESDKPVLSSYGSVNNL